VTGPDTSEQGSEQGSKPADVPKSREERLYQQVVNRGRMWDELFWWVNDQQGPIEPVDVMAAMNRLYREYHQK
jgi:hypothetical protein